MSFVFSALDRETAATQQGSTMKYSGTKPSGIGSRQECIGASGGIATLDTTIPYKQLLHHTLKKPILESGSPKY